MYTFTRMKAPNIFTNPEFMHPAPAIVLALIKKHGGLTLAGIHAFGYRSVFDSLEALVADELVFKHPLATTVPGGFPETLYLPNA